MWILLAIVAVGLWQNCVALRNRVGHYPGDVVALATWRLLQTLKLALLTGVFVWAFLAFPHFVLKGDFLLWLLSR